MAEKVINFGYYVRMMRERMDLSRTQFILRAGIKLSERRLWQIEMGMPEPQVLPQKFEAIARALTTDRDGLEKAWQTTPVPVPNDATRPRKTVRDALTIWLAEEAARLGISRIKAAERVKILLGHFNEAERDRLYGVKGTAGAAGGSSSSMRISRGGKDARLRPAAKTMSRKPKSET